MCQCVFVCLCAMILVRIGKIGLNRRPSHMCFCPFECLSVCVIVFVLCLSAHMCVCMCDDKGGG